MEFFKLNKFKSYFLVIFISITATFFLFAKIFDASILKSIFSFLYSPAILLINIPCLASEVICENNLMIFRIISIPVFIMSIYILACLFDLNSRKAISSLKLGFASLIMFFIFSTLGYDLLRDIGLQKIISSAWLMFLILIPVIFTAGYGLVCGVKSLKEQKKLFGILGILLTLLILCFLITWVTVPIPCC